MPRHGSADLLAANASSRGLDPDDTLALFDKSSDFAVLNQIDTVTVRAPCISPGNRIVARNPRPVLPQRAVDRESGARRVVEIRRDLADLVTVQDIGIDAVETHRIAAPFQHRHLRVGMPEIELAPLRHHHIEVQVLGETLPQPHRLLIKERVAGRYIVGAHDGRIPACIAAAKIAFLEHRDIGDTV